MNELKEFQKKVIANAKHVKGMKIGDRAPDFTLPNALGNAISLSGVLELGPVILKFYRGEWCPICNLDLCEVQKHMAQLESLGARVLAISPQKPDDALTMKQKNDLDFEILSDVKQEVILLYNLQFDPGDDYHQRRDLSVLNGDGSKLIPVPATFVIKDDFTIVAAHVEANYTQRMYSEEIVKVLSKL